MKLGPSNALVALAALIVLGVPMSSDAKVQNRLWVQVMPTCKVPPPGVEVVAIPAALVADLVASGVGAIVKSAADRLIATDQYRITTVLAYEPGFVIRANATIASFMLNCITLNVGPTPIAIVGDKTGVPLPIDEVEKSAAYGESPVVIRLEIDESADGTAIAARVTHWKYTRFLDPSPTSFRTPQRKVTVEVKLSDVDGGVLFATAMQVQADSGTLPNARPNDGERLPWMKRPVRNFAGERTLGKDQTFGPVNIEATIAEVAEPSGFAKMVGTSLGNQKASIDSYVKDRVTQALDETEAANARLASIKEATAALDEYTAAHVAAGLARLAFDAATDPAAKSGARQTLELTLATLRQKEVIARAAFDRADLAFEPLPAVGIP